MQNKYSPTKQGLNDPALEHDSCGVGFLVNINGERSHDIITRSIDVLKTMREVQTHRTTRRTPYEGVPISVPAS